MNHDHTVCVHEAASNNDANLLALFLNNEGIEALAVEDYSADGLGVLPDIHRPKVFVHRDDAQVALEIVARFQKKEPVSRVSLNLDFCYHCGAECKSGSETCGMCGRTIDQEYEHPHKPIGMLIGMLTLLFVIIIVCLSVVAATMSGGRALDARSPYDFLP